MPARTRVMDEDQILAENERLRLRLHEAEQALDAIRNGAVDALVLDGPVLQQVFTLSGAETPYRAFVEHMQEGAVSMSLDGTILYCNRRFADMVGLPLEQVVGKAFQAIATEPKVVAKLLIQAHHGCSRGEMSLLRPDATEIPVFASIQKLKADWGLIRTGADLCMVVTELTDIVAARLLVDELELRVHERTAELVAKNLELEGFTYSVSHDMRSPLRAIVGNAHMVVEDEGHNLTENGKSQLRSLSRAATKMAQLVDDLLQFARLGGGSLVIERTNLSRLASRVAKEVAYLYPDEELEFSTEEDIWADCDARFLGMVLHNLIDNACKYRKPGEPARISFGIEQLLGYTVYFVRDEGIGFDMQYVPKIFTPFERLHRDNEYPGTGIGLANVKRAIERHGGAVWAEGQLGVGAKFSFTLPHL